MSLKSVLIITDALTRPLYHPRVRNIYNHLKNKNIQVDWITEKYEEIPLEFQINIKTIPFYKTKGPIGKIEWIIKNILSLLFDYKNSYFTKKTIQEVKNKEYDIVFCSTFHTFGLKTAYKISQIKKIPLHIDLRDIAEQCQDNEYTNKRIHLPKFIANYYRKINIKRRNKIIKSANSISTVSPWHLEYLSKFNSNVKLIYNGYDNKLFIPQTTKNKYFDIVYTGKWYSENLQDPTLLLAALSKITETNIRLVIYTNKATHNIIKKIYNKYNLQQELIIKDYVNNNQVPSILNQSSIILVLTNKGNHGIMTTKFFEALGVEKPILCVRSDEENLAKVIKDTECGIAATNVDEVENFIIKYYNQWKIQGYTHITVKYKEQFSRQKQALQFEEIFNSLLNK